MKGVFRERKWLAAAAREELAFSGPQSDRFVYTPEQPRTSAIVNTSSSAYREIPKLDSYCRDFNHFRPAWSWDNRYILCVQREGGMSHLLRISVADGQIRELLSSKDRAALKTAAFFSRWPFRRLSRGRGPANLHPGG